MVRAALRADATAVARHDARRGRETDAGALELRAAVKALERGEQPIRVGRVEAHAVVLDEERPPAAPVLFPDLDGGLLPLARELPGVPEEVLQHAAHERGVTGGWE